MTKYDKGSFITVPNKEKLLGLKPSTQILYLWLCNHINKDSTCYPSRKKLAKECGFKSVRTVDLHLKILVERGLIAKNHRAKDNLKQSNLYTVIVSKKSESKEVEQKLPIYKQAISEEVEQILHEGGANIALGGGANIAHRTQLSSLTQSNELNPYILSDDNTQEGSLKEIKNSEDEADSSSQSERQEVTESPKPSTPEDRKWFKEYFCETFSLYTINELTGEKIYSTPEPEVVQNIKIKEFMDANTRQTAESKVGWFKGFCRTKQGKWIKNITFNVFIQQLPNYIEDKLDMERILAKKETEKREQEDIERKREDIERKMKEEQEAILTAEANYEADLKNALDVFQKLNDEAKVDFFFDNAKDENFRFYRNENDFFVLLPEMAKVLVYYFDSKEEYWKQMLEYREDIEKFSNLTPRERIELFYDKTSRSDCLKELYITIVPEELREEVKNYSDFNEFIMWRWNEKRLKELTEKESEI